MTDAAHAEKSDIDREVDLTHRTLRRHGIPANYGDATYLVARAHERRSMDDLLARISSGRTIQPWNPAHMTHLVSREFEVAGNVLRQALDELHAAIHPTHSTVTALRARINIDPTVGDMPLSDLPQTGQMRRKLAHLEAEGIETLGVFALRAHDIAPVWTDAVLKALAVSAEETPHDDGG